MQQPTTLILSYENFDTVLILRDEDQLFQGRNLRYLFQNCRHGWNLRWESILLYRIACVTQNILVVGRPSLTPLILAEGSVR